MLNLRYPRKNLSNTLFKKNNRLKPPDACYIEFMRFRVRPPKNRELPLQLKAVICVTGKKVFFFEILNIQKLFRNIFVDRDTS